LNKISEKGNEQIKNGKVYQTHLCDKRAIVPRALKADEMRGLLQ
jgi:hypothetical protein